MKQTRDEKIREMGKTHTQLQLMKLFKINKYQVRKALGLTKGQPIASKKSKAHATLSAPVSLDTKSSIRAVVLFGDTQSVLNAIKGME